MGIIPTVDETPQSQELSERELEIVRLVATGATNAQIARELFISPNTVKVHLRNIFGKLGVDSRTEATMVALRRGWVAVPASPFASQAGAEAGGDAPGAGAPQPAGAGARLKLPLLERVYFVLAALLSIALLYAAWPRAEASDCSRSIDSEHCAAGVAAIADSRWAARALMPSARARLALVSLPAGLGASQARLLAIGGETENGVTGVVEAFTPAANTWTSLPDKPTPVANAGAALVGARVYVPGGSTAARAVLAAVEIYDPRADTWSAGAAMPGPRSGYALAVIGERLYVLGGTDGQGYPAETYILDASVGVWATGAALPTPRAYAAAAVVQGEIYVVGGYNLEREFDTCERYDPVADRWQACAPLSVARGGIGAGTVLDRLYVVGGGWTRVLAFSERYDPATGAWARFDTPLATQWRNMGVAVLEGDLFAVGGWDGTRYLASVEQYQAVYKSYLPTTKH